MTSATRDLRFAIQVRAKPGQIYRALTCATELCRWWLDGAETDARSSGRFRMVWPKVGAGKGGRKFPPHVALGDSEGRFVDLDKGRKVGWMWTQPRPAHYPPLATFFIEKHGRNCEVTLIHAGFPAKASADKYFQGCAQGWEDCLAKLKLYLEAGRSCKTKILTFDALPALLKASR